MNSPIFDIHTHNPLRTDAVVNLPQGVDIPPEGCFSVGIHPWRSAEADEAVLQWVARCAAMPQVAAIGECGIDIKRGAPLPRQLELLRRQALLAAEAGKPLLLHNVGGSNEIIALHRELKPQVPWIVHGFRGKPQLARQLAREGLWLSFGERFNPEAVAAVPPQQRLVETDDSELPVELIAARAGIELRDLRPLLGL